MKVLSFAVIMGLAASSAAIASDNPETVTKKDCKSIVQIEKTTVEFLFGERLSRSEENKFLKEAKLSCDEAVRDGLTVEEASQRGARILDTVTVPGPIDN